MKHELTETEWEIVQAHRRMMKRIERAKARRRMANARALRRSRINQSVPLKNVSC